MISSDIKDFCILDALQVLTNDNQARIHLNDPDFVYKTISKKSEQLDGAKLIYPEDISAKANSIKYHESRLNASLSVSYQASVPLDPSEFKNTCVTDEDLNRYGWRREDRYTVNCFRTYNIILDGSLNTTKLVLSNLSESSKIQLHDLLIPRLDGKYVLDLEKLPIIGQNCSSSEDITELAKDCWMQYLRNAKISVFKYLLKNTEKFEDVSPDQEKLAFLAENYYIKNGSYQPPKSQADTTEVRSVCEFMISFKGYSKASASSVIKKIDAGKSVTNREKAIEHFYLSAKNLPEQIIKDNLECANLQQSALAAKIQRSKFALILNNKIEDMSVTIDPNEVIALGLDPVVAEFNITQKEIEV